MMMDSTAVFTQAVVYKVTPFTFILRGTVGCIKFDDKLLKGTRLVPTVQAG